MLTELTMFSGVDGQLVIYHCKEGLTSSGPLTVVSPIPQVQLRWICICCICRVVSSIVL